MKKTLNWTFILLAGLLLWPATATAQEETDEQFNQRVDPDGIFDFLDRYTYSDYMPLVAVVKKNNQTVTNALIAVYASDGIRGKDVIGNGDMGPSDISYINVYGEGPVPLFFKVYTGGQIYVVDQGLSYGTNGVGTTSSPYVITLQNPVIPGDANGDGTVNAADPVAVANYIIGQPPITFVKTAADVNNDGSITVADAAGIVKMIL